MGVRHALARLLDGLELPRLRIRQGLHHQRAAELGQAVVQGGGGVLRGDVEHAGQEHVARVQTRIHLHDDHAGLRVTRFNGTVNRCRATPAWQQRRVDVEATQTRGAERPLRQDEAISGHHHHIGVGGCNGGLGLGCVVGVFAIQTQAQRLGDGDVVLQGQLLDRRSLQLHAATGGAVGLRQHQGHLVACGQDLGQSHGSKFGRARKNNAHERPLA